MSKKKTYKHNDKNAFYGAHSVLCYAHVFVCVRMDFELCFVSRSLRALYSIHL